MKKLYKLFLVSAFMIGTLTSNNSYSIPTPGPEEPAYDDDGNPTYVIKYGKGDRLDQATGKPLNLIQITCKGEGVDQAPEGNMEECRADDSLVDFKYGWMDFATYKGWRAYHAECHVCHGPDAMGSTYAPSLMKSVQEGLTWDDFFAVIINGRYEADGAQKGNVMPAFGENTNVAPHVEDMFRYIKARADDKIRRGVRLPKLPKFKEE
ncbi:c-type cytochrome [Rickettsiales bacterium]|nr:c-type cytochrome [Rickettsiales bacterium]